MFFFLGYNFSRVGEHELDKLPDINFTISIDISNIECCSGFVKCKLLSEILWKSVRCN